MTHPHSRYGGAARAFEPDLDVQQATAERTAASVVTMQRDQAEVAAYRARIDGLGEDALSDHLAATADPWQTEPCAITRCCTACDGEGYTRSAPETGGRCWDCHGTGHAHPLPAS